MRAIRGEDDEAEARREGVAALERLDWATARTIWQQLAVASPPNKHYRAQLGYARAGELLAAGESDKAREELERVLRLEPAHEGAMGMLATMRKRGGRISRWLLNR